MPDKNKKSGLPAVMNRIFQATRCLGAPLVLAMVLFASAGRLDMPFAWIYVALYALSMVVVHFVAAPDLRQEGLRTVTTGRDRLSYWFLPPLSIAHWIIAGLDTGRFHWSDSIPLTVRVVALVVYIASSCLAIWAVYVNRFFSSSVRIQHERGHYVITTGPYQYVRHPGYLAALLRVLCGCLALGSWAAMLAYGGYLLAFIRRAALEDRFLHEDLAGYADYAAKVRYRLLPGIW